MLVWVTIYRGCRRHDGDVSVAAAEFPAGAVELTEVAWLFSFTVAEVAKTSATFSGGAPATPFQT